MVGMSFVREQKEQGKKRGRRISRRDFMGAVRLGRGHGWKDDQRVPLV